jgi:hypothetical protein
VRIVLGPRTKPADDHYLRPVVLLECPSADIGSTTRYSERVAVVLILVVLGLIVGLCRLAANRRTAPIPRARVLAPDDDPDFLRELDRRTRRRDDDSS